jgi:small subunit ribosomal protein S3
VGQKCNPIGFRVGITEGWKSRWYAPKAAFGNFLVEDEKIRRFVDNELNKKPPFAGVSRVEIERTSAPRGPRSTGSASGSKT